MKIVQSLVLPIVEIRVATIVMCKNLVIAIVFLLAIVGMARARGLQEVHLLPSGERYFVSRILDASHLVLQRDMGETSFILRVSAGDSMKIDCNDCKHLMGDGKSLGRLSMQIKSPSGAEDISSQAFGHWMRVPISVGKIGIVFQRDGFGERFLVVNAVTISLKTSVANQHEAGKSLRMLEVNHLYLPKHAPSAFANETIFKMAYKQEDSYLVTVNSLNTRSTVAVVGSVFKQGEEFAQQPVTFSAPAPLPSSGEGSGLFGFSFSEVSAVKGMDFYHINIDRIPLHSTWEHSSQDK